MHVRNYDYRIWSRIAQDKATANGDMQSDIAYSEYASNQVRVLCGTIKAREKRLLGLAERKARAARVHGKLGCPCMCSFEAQLASDITRHITVSHPLTTCKWECTCGYTPLTVKDAQKHSRDCASLGTVKMLRSTRKEWRMTAYGKLTETAVPAVWLLAEGDEAVWDAEEHRRQSVRKARRKWRMVENEMKQRLARRARNEVEGSDDWRAEGANEEEICRVWTDGACEHNGRPDAIAGWGVYYGEGDERNVHAELRGPLQTNQRAELRAAIYVVKQFSKLEPPEPPGKYVLATDSTYVTKGIPKVRRWAGRGWRKDDGTTVANVDLIVV